VDEAGRERIADRMTEVDLPPDRVIVRQGEIGTGFFLIVRGHARVVRDDDLLAELGPGAFFGELSLVDQQPRIAHVITDEPTDCLAIASWDFETLLESQPRLTLALLRGVVRRLRETGEHHHH
jgi:CRP-like cAMP-binding protein